jgi:hypothetical protein
MVQKARVGARPDVPNAALYAMATLHLVPTDLQQLYHVHEWRNAAGILKTACPAEWADILAVLREFRLLESEIRAQGGNRSLISPDWIARFTRAVGERRALRPRS